jgi:hypothetical protein
MQNKKKLVDKLQPALELKKAIKAALEAELRTLTAEIEADEKMAELPESMENTKGSFRSHVCRKTAQDKALCSV